MAAFLLYVIKASIVMALPHSLYGLCLRRETLHTLNRAVSLFIMAAAVALPAALAAALSLPLQAYGGVKKKERTVRLGGEVHDSFTKARIKAAVTITSEDSALTLTDTCRILNTWSR